MERESSLKLVQKEALYINLFIFGTPPKGLKPVQDETLYMNLFIFDTPAKEVNIDHEKRWPQKDRKSSKTKDQFGQLGEKQDCQSSNPSIYSHVNVLNLIK